MVLPSLICHAPAKINLSLAVRSRRPDGFHELESWVTPVGLADTLQISAADALGLGVAGVATDVPEDDRNLVRKAARALAQAAGQPCAAAIRLTKKIPPGTGLGGGSSDAAAALMGLNQLWGLDWPRERLEAVAAQVGSDVPMFLARSPAVIRGRGERVEPLRRSFSGWMVLIIPPFTCGTREVYEAFSIADAPSHADEAPWLFADEPASELMRRLFNDLEPAAFAVQPKLCELHRRVNGLEGRPVRMTGSGSALYTLFDTQEEAAAWRAAALTRSNRDVVFHVIDVPGNVLAGPADGDASQV